LSVSVWHPASHSRPSKNRNNIFFFMGISFVEAFCLPG
jgi:hypothetical protein